ncbi:MAG: chemotaxis-specific protein-glutamate methyltransferase CheB [Planctomycetota bacterium]
MQTERLRVLVVDDSAVMRRAITRIVESDPSLELVGIGRNGKDAIDKVNRVRPQVLTLDIEMPEMDGLQALSRLPVDCQAPLPAVLMCSSLTSDGSHAALKALRMGAADVIGKNPAEVGGGSDRFAKELLAKIHAIGGGKRRGVSGGTGAPDRAPIGSRSSAGDRGETPPRAAHVRRPPDSVRDTVRRLELERKPVNLIVIGSSTGGPPALEDTLNTVPAAGCPPIVIAQHMPKLFTGCLAERLDRHGLLRVIHAEKDIPRLEPGTAYVICGGLHGRVGARRDGGYRLDLGDSPAEALYKPSVDVLFDSAAGLAGETLALVLTGMGEDGLIGGRRFVASGGRLLSQHEDSCVVFGMPKAVEDSGLSRARLDPKGLASVLTCVTEHGSARDAA